MADHTDDSVPKPVALDSSAECERETVPIVRKPIDRYSRLMMSPNNKSSLRISRGPPKSLQNLMASRGGSMKAAHAPFDRNTESSLRQNNKKKGVSFGEIDYGYGDAAPDNSTTDCYGYGDAAPDAEDYGYGEAAPDEPKKEEDEEQQQTKKQEEEPALKRRRYQRRNSKTPAMLIAPHLLHLDLLEDRNEEQEKRGVAAVSSPLMSPRSGSSLSKESWDRVLEDAEELVKHLQKRRQSQT